MSYSFSVRKATKAEAIEAVTKELAAVVDLQPVHAHDVEQAKTAAAAFVGILPDDETRDVCVSVNGSVWTADDVLRGASVSITASIEDRT